MQSKHISTNLSGVWVDILQAMASSANYIAKIKGNNINDHNSVDDYNHNNTSLICKVIIPLYYY